MRLIRIVPLAALAVGLVVACGSSEAGSEFHDPNGGGPLGDGGTLPVGPACSPPCADGQRCSYSGTCVQKGTCVDARDCEPGMVCDVNTQTCIPGGTCGAEEATGSSTPPNLLIVLDRSCSMTGEINGVTKWSIAVDAMNTLIAANIGKIRFGLELFPDKNANSCAQGPFAVPTGPGTEATVTGILTKALVKGDPLFPDGPCVTNIDTAMQAAASEPAFADTTRGNFAILLTDGKQAGCNAAGGDNGTTQILKDLYTLKKVPTFVIGFGGEIDPAQMNTFAVAGGAPTADPTTKYYKAEDKPSLAAALSAIAKKTLSCVFSLTKTPPDPTKVYAFFDNKTPVPRDPAKANGWEYDATVNAVTFYGPACDELKNAKVTDVDIVFGCAEPTPR